MCGFCFEPSLHGCAAGGLQYEGRAGKKNGPESVSRRVWWAEVGDLTFLSTFDLEY